MNQEQRVRLYAERLVRKIEAHHASEDEAGTYDPMMDAMVDLRIALGGGIPPRRKRRPVRIVSAFDVLRSEGQDRSARDPESPALHPDGYPVDEMGG